MKGWVYNVDKCSTHTETTGEKDKGARAWHVLMMSQRTKTGGTGIY